MAIPEHFASTYDNASTIDSENCKHCPQVRASDALKGRSHGELACKRPVMTVWTSL